MKARLYLLEGTYPSKVIIKNNLITKEYTYQNSQEFINDINNLFEINNNPDTTVILVLDPSICRNIAMDNGFEKFQLAGYNNLNNYDDIRFYRYDEKNDLEIFEDIYQKDIQSSDNKLLNLALQKDVNLELVKKGENLIKEIKCEILEKDENKVEIFSEITRFYDWGEFQKNLLDAFYFYLNNHSFSEFEIANDKNTYHIH